MQHNIQYRFSLISHGKNHRKSPPEIHTNILDAKRQQQQQRRQQNTTKDEDEPRESGRSWPRGRRRVRRTRQVIY